MTNEQSQAEVPSSQVPPVESGSGSTRERIQSQIMTKRMGIIALVLFAPVVLIVIAKVLRDLRSSFG